MSYETGVSRRTITALFEDRADAVDAVERLVAAGIPRNDISLVEGSGAVTSGTVRHQEMGFWDSLKDLFLPEEDRSTYAEGLRRGGHLVAARVSDAFYETALDILDDEGTVDVEERATAWKQEGWTGHIHMPATAPLSVTGSAGTGSVAGRTAGEREEVIPVVEEQLKVGKRDVDLGRVRVRSYVVEEPVSEDVTLRTERVTVERRTVDRPATGGEIREHTIDIEERGEEAVVSKDARVKEELVVKRDVDERTETVADTVKRTEVEIEDERKPRQGPRWRVKDYAGGWIYYDTEEAARASQEARNGALVEHF
jgi:uncharacterized protein (TIGR02271 family)